MTVDTSVRTIEWARRAGVFFRDRGDRMVALLEDDVVVLDASAAAIWRHLDGGRSLSELCALLADQFDVEAVDIEVDVEAGLQALEQAGLAVRR